MHTRKLMFSLGLSYEEANETKTLVNGCFTLLNTPKLHGISLSGVVTSSGCKTSKKSKTQIFRV